MHRYKWLSALLTLSGLGSGLLFSDPLSAQGVAVLSGTVNDASTHLPVANATIIVTSPALQGEQVVVTDAAGNYRIPQLPPGDYTIHIEGKSHKPYSRGGIGLRMNSQIRVNIELMPESLKEEIVIVAKAPTVDVGSTTVGVSVDQETTKRIALNTPGSRAGAFRSFENLAVMAPGAYADDFGVSINGASSPENRFQVDGLSVNNTRQGINDTPLSVEFIQEVNIATGGYMPEFGRATGGVLDAVTKSGSNEFHGSIFGSITPGMFEGARTPVKIQGTTIQTRTALSVLRDFGFDVGGPIVKDKLWFYGGLNIAYQSNEISRTLNRLRYQTAADGTLLLDSNGNPIRERDEDGFQLADFIPGTEKIYYATRDSYQYLGKLTWQLAPEHRITLTAHGTSSTSGGNGRYSLTPETGKSYFGGPSIGPGEYTGNGRKETSDVFDIGLRLSSAFLGKRLLLDSLVGWHHADFKVLPVDGSAVGSGEGLSAVPGVLWIRGQPGAHSIADFEDVPANSGCEPAGTQSAIYCPVTSYRTGGPGYTAHSVQNRVQAKMVGTYLAKALGQHVLKAGLDAEVLTSRYGMANTGGIWFLEGWDGSTFDVYHFGSAISPNEVFVPKIRENTSYSAVVGGFIQDSWNILDGLTINAGVRYDAQMIWTSADTGLNLPNQWSPRVGAIYDFTRQGRSKLFANFARYYENMPLSLADSLLISAPLTVATVSASVCDPRDMSMLAACDAAENRLPRGAAYNPNRKWSGYGSGTAPVDPDIQAQSSDEFVLGGEYEVFAGARAGLTYTHRYMNYVIEDMSRDEGFSYLVGNPGFGPTSDFPKAKREYDALTVYFQKAFSSGWLAQASYTLSHLRGNYSGLFQTGSDFPSPNHSSDFDLISMLPNRDGTLPGNRTHAIKLYGAKAFELPRSLLLNIGLSYQGLSGAPTNVLGAHPYYGRGQVFILPRGSGERLPWVHTVDSNLSVGYRIRKDNTLSVSLDIFNLFNFQAETARDESYTFANVRPILKGSQEDLPKESDAACTDSASCSYKLIFYESGAPFDPQAKNPNFGKPVAYQNPRQIRLGAKITF